MNEVFLAGTLAKDPVTSFREPGSQVTTARLCIPETRDNQTFRLWVDIEAWGKTAEVLADLQEGAAVVLKGRLKWKSWEKEGKKQGMLIVAAWSVQVLTPAPSCSLMLARWNRAPLAPADLVLDVEQRRRQAGQRTLVVA